MCFQNVLGHFVFFFKKKQVFEIGIVSGVRFSRANFSSNIQLIIFVISIVIFVIQIHAQEAYRSKSITHGSGAQVLVNGAVTQSANAWSSCTIKRR